jgi:tetratricopeptide (TPR) repeat protein
MYKRVYDLAKTVGDKSLLAIAATNLGFAYLLLDEAELSKQYSEEALALCPAKKVELKTNVLINLARANLRLGSLVEAEEQLAIVLQLTDSRHKYMGQVVGELQLGYAKLRLLQDRLEEALLYATSATEFYQSTGNGEALRQYALIIHARILNRLGRDQESIEVTKKFNEDQLLLQDENTLLFERASELIVTGKSAELHRIAMDNF